MSSHYDFVHALLDGQYVDNTIRIKLWSVITASGTSTSLTTSSSVSHNLNNDNMGLIESAKWTFCHNLLLSRLSVLHTTVSLCNKMLTPPMPNVDRNNHTSYNGARSCPMELPSDDSTIIGHLVFDQRLSTCCFNYYYFYYGG